MNAIEVRSKDKIWRYIAAGLNTHKMHYEKILITDPDGSLKMIYILFYTQKEAKSCI